MTAPWMRGKLNPKIASRQGIPGLEVRNKGEGLWVIFNFQEALLSIAGFLKAQPWAALCWGHRVELCLAWNRCSLQRFWCLDPNGSHLSGGRISHKVHIFSRMRSEGFSFNFGSLRVELCLPDVVFEFATVRNRPHVFAIVRIRLLWPCRWGEL